ncbi:uncharacterized protein LOC134981320 [Pseudophryne corroboree]|uniref:uncharacterized protein LOC134981320 n=1 Tax=Pseudophryne corroboree TaxID=495146 RepID=UPI003081CF75
MGTTQIFRLFTLFELISHIVTVESRAPARNDENRPRDVSGFLNQTTVLKLENVVDGDNNVWFITQDETFKLAEYKNGYWEFYVEGLKPCLKVLENGKVLQIQHRCKNDSGIYFAQVTRTDHSIYKESFNLTVYDLKNTTQTTERPRQKDNDVNLKNPTQATDNAQNQNLNYLFFLLLLLLIIPAWLFRGKIGKVCKKKTWTAKSNLKHPTQETESDSAVNEQITIKQNYLNGITIPNRSQIKYYKCEDDDEQREEVQSQLKGPDDFRLSPTGCLNTDYSNAGREDKC